MKIQKFEDLPIWQESRTLYGEILKITSKSSFKNFSLRNQVERATISVSSNIAEGFERGSNREFIQFLFIAKGSLGELRSQIYLIFDNKLISEEELKFLVNFCVELSRRISNFINYLKHSKITECRHKER